MHGTVRGTCQFNETAVLGVRRRISSKVIELLNLDRVAKAGTRISYTWIRAARTAGPTVRDDSNHAIRWRAVAGEEGGTRNHEIQAHEGRAARAARSSGDAGIGI